MQFKNILALLPLLASAASAFVVPENLEDGGYVVTISSDGKETLTKLEVTAEGIVETRSIIHPEGGKGGAASAKYGKQLAARNSQGSTGRTLDNHGEYNACTEGLKTIFGNGLIVQPHKIYFHTVGSTFLALCNYSGNSQGGYPYEVDNFNSVMDTSYGSWSTGWYHFSGPNKTLWRDRVGNPICTNI